MANLEDRGGQTTREYGLIQTNFSKIVTSLEQGNVLNQVAMKAFEKSLITAQSLRGFNDPGKASEFVLAMLGKIDEDRANLAPFLDCMSAVPVLNRLTTELKALTESVTPSGQQSGSAGQQAPAGSNSGIIVRTKDVNYLVTALHSYAFKWQEIGSSLGFQYGEIDNIAYSNPRATAPQLLTRMLSNWSQWPTAEHRDNPTLEKLRDALRSGLVGLGAAANELYEKRNSLPSRQS